MFPTPEIENAATGYQKLLITHLPPRDPGAAPVEKKKKGKRRNQEPAVQEGAESDDTTSMSALNMGGEDSQDHLDNAVSGPGTQWVNQA